MTRAASLVAVGFIVAFGLGWLGAELRNVDRIPIGEVVTNQWEGDLFRLVKNRINHEPVDSASLVAGAKSGLDLQSVTLASAYDGLPSSEKRRIAGDLPAARAIVERSRHNGLGVDMPHLAIFIECVDKVESQGGSVYKCADEHQGWRPMVNDHTVVSASTSAVK